MIEGGIYNEAIDALDKTYLRLKTRIEEATSMYESCSTEAEVLSERARDADRRRIEAQRELNGVRNALELIQRSMIPSGCCGEGCGCQCD